MKKILVSIVVFVLTFALVAPVSAQMGMMGGENGDKTNLDSAVSEILKAQNLTSAKDIDCSKVTGDQFETLGDGWMDYQIGNEAAHERMDNMMGGEGSDQLRNAHIQMGKNYLGCSTDGDYDGMPMMYGSRTNGDGWGGMMGTGTSKNAMYSSYKTGFNGVHTVLAAVTWVSLVLFLLSGTRYFWKNTKK